MSEGDRGKHQLNLRGKFMYAPPSDDTYRNNYDRIFKRENNDSCGDSDASRPNERSDSK